MRRPCRTTAVRWHTETHDPHAQHHHESSDRLFRGVYYEAVIQHVTYVPDFCRLVELYTLHGERLPRNFQFSRTGVVAQKCPSTCQITREDGAIIDFLLRFLVRLLLFTACPRLVTLAALQATGTFVCPHDYRAVRTVQAAHPL